MPRKRFMRSGMKRIVQVNKPDTENYLTVNEAAFKLNVSPAFIRNYLSWGYFTTYKFKNWTMVNKEEIETWKNVKNQKKESL